MSYRVRCASGLQYNPVSKHCDWPSNVHCVNLHTTPQQPAVGGSTLPPAYTQPPVQTQNPVVYTQRPPVYTQPPVQTQNPVVYTQRPPVYTQPPAQTRAPVVYTQPPIQTQSPVYTSAPGGQTGECFALVDHKHGH